MSERLRRIEAAADRAERDCRRFIEGTFVRVDEVLARQSLDELRAALNATGRVEFHPPDGHKLGRGSWQTDNAGCVIESLSYEDREGDPAFNGAFDKW